VDDLSTVLADGVKGEKGSGGAAAGLLEEFAAGSVEWIFAGMDLALGDGPNAEVLLPEVGSTGMHEEDLRLI
jgi:hypothetical protein